MERAQLGRDRVQVDDLIDAAACLATAIRIRDGIAVTLPAGEPQTDQQGLRVEIIA